MTNMLAFDKRVRLAYELGRLKMSIRISQWIVPLTALALFETHGHVAVWVMAFVLLLAAIAFRWHSRAGCEDVNAALQSGVLPLLVGLALGRMGCPRFSVFSVYGALCAALGGVSGLWIVLQARSAEDYTIGRWAATVGVAALLSGLGCSSSLGTGNVIGIAAGMALSSAAVFVLARRVTNRRL